MKVLIVEDDAHKRQSIRDFVLEELPGSTVREAQSYQSGLEAAIELRPDLVLLDMTIPNYDASGSDSGEETRPYGGRDILRELTRKRIAATAIVITGFNDFGRGEDAMTLEQLKTKLKREFPTNYAGAIYYHPSQAKWKSDLRRMLSERRVGR